MSHSAHQSRSVAPLIRVGGWMVMIAAFYFIGRTLVHYGGEISHYSFALQPWRIVMSLLVGGLGFISFALVWRGIAYQFDHAHRLSRGAALRIYSTSAITKYIPSSVVLYASRVYLAIQAGVTRSGSVMSTVYETALSVVGQCIFVGIALLTMPFIALPIAVVALVLVLWLLLPIHSDIMQMLLRWVARWRPQLTSAVVPRLRPRVTLTILGQYVVVSCLNGLGFYLLLGGVFPGSTSPPLLIMGMYIFAGVIGTVVFFVPGGLGIREGVLVALLSLIMSPAAAIVISLVARAWTIVVEVGCYATIRLIVRQRSLASASQTSRD